MREERIEHDAWPAEAIRLSIEFLVRSTHRSAQLT